MNNEKFYVKSHNQKGGMTVGQYNGNTNISYDSETKATNWVNWSALITIFLGCLTMVIEYFK